MSNLDELAKKYNAYVKSDGKGFRRKARILQAIWRTEKGYPMGTHNNAPLGNRLPMPWAKDTLSNYLNKNIQDVVRQEVPDGEHPEGKLYGKPRIYNNLLSSQPLCFNLFAELQINLDLATEVFKKLLPDKVGQVTEIQFEYSPGRGNPNYTGDRSAFDIYVRYKTKQGEDGFVGIEVKYHENMKVDPADITDRHDEVARQMECFKEEFFPILKKSPLEQIWRDHLLAVSILQADNFTEGLFVFLYHQDNLYCKQALEDYQKCLLDSNSFATWTLDQIASVIQKISPSKWIADFKDRYLDFSKVDKLLNS